MKILDKIIPAKTKRSKDISIYLEKVARLGGYLARATGNPPGNIVMWRGISRLTDIEIGNELAKNCG